MWGDSLLMDCPLANSIVRTSEFEASIALTKPLLVSNLDCITSGTGTAPVLIRSCLSSQLMRRQIDQ